MRSRVTMCGFVLCAGLFLLVCCPTVLAADAPSREEASRALRRAVTFFRERISTRGGYLWKYSLDLTQRWGEGVARPRQMWIQPPGTPSVGGAYLKVWERTGDSYYLDAARETAHILADAQLASGGWFYNYYLDPKPDQRFWHRSDLENARFEARVRRNTTVFDDDVSQSALRMLMRFDRAAEFKDDPVHRAAAYALSHFIQAQYPSGGWPQRYSRPFDAADWPVKRAHYPDTWSRVHLKADYASFYTLNDSTIPDLIRTMLLAYEVYQDEVYLSSARKGGDFLILAQMPDPQPGWAQQYDADMAPAWARRFEPPAIVTGESMAAARALMSLYIETGESKYREPIPAFLDWLERSKLPDGQHARFYELKGNRPNYFNRKYELVYTDDDLPTHYGFKGKLNVEGLRAAWASLERAGQQRLAGDNPLGGKEVHRPFSDAQRAEVRRIIDALDSQGRWVENDKTISSSTFIRNLDLLSAYIASE